ncbi:uncharacterized protein LOC134815290 [Bolinopsis microptera]|uniref:uncharacterized protein LOC134815290 n=1 Tax=Bolinopsis microptera TaxID=2820187 RepID=UPI003079AD00
MASSANMVLGFMLLLASASSTNNSPRNNIIDEDNAADLKDLLHSSMQSIILLNDLVTKLTEKVVDLTISFADTKADMRNLKTTVEEERANLKTTVEEERANLKTTVEEKMTDLKTTVEEDMANLKTTVDSEMANLNTTVEEEMADLKTTVEKDMADLKTTVEEDRADLKATPREVMIVSEEEEAGEARCARVCAGTTGRGTTSWIEYSSTGIQLSVDISDCGFVKVPTVTTSVEGKGYHWKATGLAAVYHTTTTSFNMNVDGPVSGYDPQDGNAESWGWNVEWISVGYIC